MNCLNASHLYCGPAVAAANIQLAASIPNFLILESIQKMGGFHAALLTKPLCWEDGHIIPPTTPGLGIELNMDVVAQNLWDGSRLHLEMGQHPFDPGGMTPLPAANWRWRFAAKPAANLLCIHHQPQPARNQGNDAA